MKTIFQVRLAWIYLWLGSYSMPELNSVMLCIYLFLISTIFMPATLKPTLLMSSHKLCEGQSKGFIIDDIDLFVLRHQGRVLAYLNSCPHRQVPPEFLPDQFLDEDKQFIQCATHGALFTIENGLCISGPCNNQSLVSLYVEERDEKIYCTISQARNF